MSPERYAQVKQLFLELIDLPAAQRAARIDALCEGDPALRRELAGLLEHHDAEAARREGESSAPGRFLKDRVATRVEAAAPPLAIDPELPKRSKWRTWISRLALAALATLLIATVGWLTDRQVRSRLEAAAKNQLQVQLSLVHESLAMWAEQRKDLVQAWARAPEVEQAAAALLQAAEATNPRQALLDSTARADLDTAIRAMAGESPPRPVGIASPPVNGADAPDPRSASQRVKYVLYRQDGLQLASWDPANTAVGRPALPERVDEIRQVLAHGPVIHHPEWLKQFPGFDPQAEDLVEPTMWISVPVEAAGQRAVLLVRGIGLNQDFNELIRGTSIGGFRIFAFDDQGRLLHEPPPNDPWQAALRRAKAAPSATGGSAASQTAEKMEWATGNLALRDPGGAMLEGYRLDRRYDGMPLHSLVQQVLPTADPAFDVQGHRDYLGRRVIGAAQWLPQYAWGILVEQDVSEAYAPLASVRRAFLALLSAVGVGTALAAWQAYRLGRASGNARVQTEPRLGPYELVGVLGSGGMGTVFRARHRLLKRHTAVKVLNPGSMRPDALPRFEREVHVAARLRCPHTVSIYDYGVGPMGQPYFAMELLEGMTLDVVVARTGPMPPARVIHLLLQLLESLAEAHGMGLVHRDIKPQNLMLTRRGGIDDWLVVFDFGLAKPIHPDPQLFETRDRIWAGTPAYMAPERIMSPGKCDTRSDLFAVGAVGYFLLCGHDPHRGTDPQKVLEQIVSAPPIKIDEPIRQTTPPRLTALIESCLAKDPADRPSSADELLDDLAGLESANPWTRQQARSAWLKLLEASPAIPRDLPETERANDTAGGVHEVLPQPGSARHGA